MHYRDGVKKNDCQALADEINRKEKEREMEAWGESGKPGCVCENCKKVQGQLDRSLVVAAEQHWHNHRNKGQTPDFINKEWKAFCKYIMEGE
jgi:hypothetical protein